MIITALTEMFRLRHPIVLGPMGAVSGGHLAATVSNAGGLGLVGGGYGDPAWLRRELSRASEETRASWGVGLITWSIEPSVLDLALSYRPTAFMLSFGDPRPYASAIKSAGCKLICQVQDVEQARVARDAGADLIVAEGDLVSVRWTARGTNTGSGNGIPATGKKVQTTGITMFRFANGAIAEEWTAGNQLGLMRQLGLLPAPAASTEQKGAK